MNNHTDNIREELADLICRENLGQLDEAARIRLEELRKGYACCEPQRGQVIRRLYGKKEFEYAPAYADFIRKRKKRRDYRFIWRISVAAAAMIAVLVGVKLFWSSGHSASTVELMVKKEVVEPGRSLAFITLANGERIELGKRKHQLQETNGTVVVFDSAAVEYKKTPAGGPLVYNSIVVPRGGEFQLVLSDGSKVWMNADSKLKYPVVFTASQREVYLEGEAYFEVAKDREHPFIVHTSRGAVKVLGTGFNVRDYRDEARVVTTLVEGQVAYQPGCKSTNQVVLQPGFQVEDREGQALVAREVDVMMYTGWKDGKYIFENTTLEEIMQVLSKWYDIEVFYTRTEVRDLHFTGDLERYENVNAFLEFMEIGGNVRFSVNNKTIIIE